MSSGENLVNLERLAMGVGEDNFFDVNVTEGATAGGNNANFLGATA